MIEALVIDDNRQMADGLCQLLSFYDIKAHAVYGPLPGLSELKQRTPNIIFLDINMPGLSGHEVLGFLKREPRLEEVPVIVVTSDDQPETIQRVHDAGAKGMIIKPVSIETLEEMLQKLELL